MRASSPVGGLPSMAEPPLHYAQTAEVAQALIAAGADPNITYGGGVTPLHETTVGDKAQVLIAAGSDPAATTEDGWTTLHSAARGDGTVTQILLTLGADVDARSSLGLTPLHAAEHFESAKLLIAAGADVQRRDRTGRTPLHVVAEEAERGDVIGVLVSAGARVGARDELGQTPLHKSVHGFHLSSYESAIEALIGYGADINARDQEGNTPLHLAAMSRSYLAGHAIDALLDAGAAAGLRNDQRQTAWELATQNDSEYLKDSEAYWRLNEARFQASRMAMVPDREARTAEATQRQELPLTSGPTPSGETRVGAINGPGTCEIPGFPHPNDVRGIGLGWCPSSVNFQLRAIALQAAGAWCGIRTGSASTAAEVSAGHDIVNTACDRLDALTGNGGGPSCQCPSGYRP